MFLPGRQTDRDPISPFAFVLCFLVGSEALTKKRSLNSYVHTRGDLFRRTSTWTRPFFLDPCKVQRRRGGGGGGGYKRRKSNGVAKRTPAGRTTTCWQHEWTPRLAPSTDIRGCMHVRTMRKLLLPYSFFEGLTNSAINSIISLGHRLALDPKMLYHKPILFGPAT